MHTPKTMICYKWELWSKWMKEGRDEVEYLCRYQLIHIPSWWLCCSVDWVERHQRGQHRSIARVQVEVWEQRGIGEWGIRVYWGSCSARRNRWLGSEQILVLNQASWWAVVEMERCEDLSKGFSFHFQGFYLISSSGSGATRITMWQR